MPIGPKPPLLLRLPDEKNMPKLASIEIAPAIVAVTVMISVSRLLDVGELVRDDARDLLAATAGRRSPVLTATAAFSGLRPVAKAFGWSSLMM